MNPLENFEQYHTRKILRELKAAGIELKEENIPRIIEETSFRVRRQKHPEECPPYYPQDRPCIEVQDFNCFFCCCPEYESTKDEGGCRLHHQSGKWHSPYPHSQSGRVWDCSDCSLPHFPDYVEQYLRENLERLKQITDED